MYPQGVCRIRKPVFAGNGCAIFPVFRTEAWGRKIRCSAADDSFRVSLTFLRKKSRTVCACPGFPFAGFPLGLGLK